MTVVDIPVSVSLLLIFLLAGVAFVATGIALMRYRRASESAWTAKPSRLVPMAMGMISMGMMFTLYLVGLIVL
jgi:hypothetical protein